MLILTAKAPRNSHILTPKGSLYDGASKAQSFQHMLPQTLYTEGVSSIWEREGKYYIVYFKNLKVFLR